MLQVKFYIMCNIKTILSIKKVRKFVVMPKEVEGEESSLFEE